MEGTQQSTKKKDRKGCVRKKRGREQMGEIMGAEKSER